MFRSFASLAPVASLTPTLPAQALAPRTPVEKVPVEVAPLPDRPDLPLDQRLNVKFVDAAQVRAIDGTLPSGIARASRLRPIPSKRPCPLTSVMAGCSQEAIVSRICVSLALTFSIKPSPRMVSKTAFEAEEAKGFPP